MATEVEVESAFIRWLIERGWDASVDNPDHADVIARRGAEVLIAEVKGSTSAPGTDIDTGYGQLLRRMVDDDVTRYALVVPESLAAAVDRVSARVHRALDITVFLVDDLGRVREVPQK